MVTTGYGIRNVPELAPALDEIARVLRPGGRFLSLDFDRPGNGLVRAVYFTYLTVVGSILGVLLHGDPDTYRYIPQSLRTYPGSREVGQMLKMRGFEGAGDHPGPRWLSRHARRDQTSQWKSIAPRGRAKAPSRSSSWKSCAGWMTLQPFAWKTRQSTRSEADYNFVSNEIFVRFEVRSRKEPARRFGFLPGTRVVTEKVLSLAVLAGRLASDGDVGPADYTDEGMVQYLRTERIIPPYQTRGYKLVELLRIYESADASGHNLLDFTYWHVRFEPTHSEIGLVFGRVRLAGCSRRKFSSGPRRIPFDRHRPR